MPEHKEKEDFELASGEKVFTFEALKAAKANLDLFEEIGKVNTGDKGGLKGSTLRNPSLDSHSNRTVYRRKAAGNIGKELIKK